MESKQVMFDLRQARQYAKFTQKDIAKKLGIAQLTYQKYEAGERKMRVDVAKDFSKVVNIPIDNIIF
ncbi:helix-turn-helix transcriptional regulator [Limosilactobacillus antri]|uniref:helix-turn-helix transcriptional regulator n=1 Tax=Limosilactobacillus antri TaxID=227943 RepID=UPI001F5AB036|nr:helix-turn-helix transcriptional regulator [Limosilactobacillus antri]